MQLQSTVQSPVFYAAWIASLNQSNAKSAPEWNELDVVEIGFKAWAFLTQPQAIQTYRSIWQLCGIVAAIVWAIVVTVVKCSQSKVERDNIENDLKEFVIQPIVTEVVTSAKWVASQVPAVADTLEAVQNEETTITVRAECVTEAMESVEKPVGDGIADDTAAVQTIIDDRLGSTRSIPSIKRRSRSKSKGFTPEDKEVVTA